MVIPAQLPTLRTAINNETDPTFVVYRANGQTNQMATFFNVVATPTFYVKRTSLSRHEILTGTSDTGSVFGWAGNGYIGRSQGERDAFREMFNSTGAVNPALPSIVAAFADIFSGSGGGSGQPNRDHITAMSRRTAKRGERLYATGTGSQAAPGIAVFEGDITDADISAALALP